MTENLNFQPLRFHNVHAKGITLSHDGTIARRKDDYGFVFSSRPISVDEKVTLKFMEVSSRRMGVSAFCFGVTSTNPNDHPFEDVRDFTYLDLIKNLNFTALPLDKKLCTRNAILTFWVSSTGHMTYEVNGESKGKFDKKIPTGVPIWALIYFFDNPVSIKLIRSLDRSASTEEATCDLERGDEVDVEDEKCPVYRGRHVSIRVGAALCAKP